MHSSLKYRRIHPGSDHRSQAKNHQKCQRKRKWVEYHLSPQLYCRRRRRSRFVSIDHWATITWSPLNPLYGHSSSIDHLQMEIDGAFWGEKSSNRDWDIFIAASFHLGISHVVWLVNWEEKLLFTPEIMVMWLLDRMKRDIIYRNRSLSAFRV